MSSDYRAWPKFDAANKCESCGTPFGMFSNIERAVFGALVVLPCVLALHFSFPKWSVEYLPHIDGGFTIFFSVSAAVLLIVGIVLAAKRLGGHLLNWVTIVMLPFVLSQHVGPFTNDPTRLSESIQELEMQTAALERSGVNGAFPAKEMRTWLDLQRQAIGLLEDRADRLGSIRVAVYSHAIFATSRFVESQGEKNIETEFDYRRSKQFWRKIGMNLSPDLIDEFVGCYRQADRPGISHRGVMKTETFKACFGTIQNRP